MDWLISLLVWHETWAYLLAWGLAGAIGAALAYPFVKRLGQSFWRVPVLILPVVIFGQGGGMALDSFKARHEADILLQHLRQQQLFVTILEVDPKAADHFREAYDQQVKPAAPNKRPGAMRALGASFVGQYFEALMMKAPDDAMMRMIGHMRRALAALKGKPTACMDYLMGRPAFVLNDLPPELRQAELDMKADIIGAASRNPAPPVAPAEVSKGMGERFHAKYRDLGYDPADIERFFELDQLPPERGCVVATELFEVLGQMDPRDAGELMRVIAGKPVDAI